MDKLAFLEGNNIKIIAPNEFQIIDKIRELPGRKYFGEYWMTPACPETIDSLILWGFEIDLKLDLFKKDLEAQKDNVINSTITGNPYPFQKEGVAFISYKNGSALIGDDPGLGKTIQAIIWMQQNNIQNVLVVCPASLKLNWQNEIKKWTNRDSEILSGINPYQPTENILIINYDILEPWFNYLNPELIIIDEAQYIRCDSNRAKTVIKLCKSIPYKIALSGTPVEGKRNDIYNLWKILSPDNCPTKNVFKRLNNNELHNNIKTFMIRRIKSEVLKELPEKTRVFIPVELTNRDEYNRAENNFISYIKKQKGLEAAKRAKNAISFTKIESLKQITAKGKMEPVKEWIKTFLQSGQKLVVFCTHTFVINELFEAFPGSLKMDGSTSMADRQKAVESFQNDPKINLFIGMLDIEGRPAGVGWTLTASYSTATIELQWNPKIHDQAEDRVHRIRQKNAVFSYYLLAKNTIEEKIASLQDKKRLMIDSVVDNTITESLLSELMNEYSKT